MALLKKLAPIGNSLGLVLERPILDLLGIDRDTMLEIRTDGDTLVIKPVRQDYLNRVQESTAKVMRVHRATLKKLAD